MFKISEFSKISQLSVKTLRYYDQMNLLKPAHIDKFTSYRYYSADQLFELHRILAFKELGFSLEQIRQMMSEHIPIEQIKGMFRLKQHEIQSMLEREQAKLDRIKERLYLIEHENTNHLSAHDVVLKEVEPQLVMSFRQKTAMDQIPELFRILDGHLQSYGQSALSKLVLWHGCEQYEDEMDIEVARVLKEPIPENPLLTLRQLPKVPMMATLIHHCRTASRCSASTELAIWIERNGYRMIEHEPRREICVPHAPSNDPESYVAELQIAVERM
ncbi:MerR family transcriptional regulator [Paenibacillus terrigena]|uniref:MerR family transcriptional regulator n=1 Tax=Paenibacillus terrigena TaxID=369333 RepID=UPI0028D03D56|nr:MerR family transcriptional regulator [Paenibacillus terrigena]